jgi:hypothetical protein
LKEVIAKWRMETGLDFIKRPDNDLLKQCIELDGRELKALSGEQLDEAILVLSNYYLYLRSESGAIAGRIETMEDVIASASCELLGSMQYSNAAERRAKAIKEPQMAPIASRVKEERAKRALLEPVVEGIRTKIDVLRRILERRAREHYVRS